MQRSHSESHCIGEESGAQGGSVIVLKFTWHVKRQRPDPCQATSTEEASRIRATGLEAKPRDPARKLLATRSHWALRQQCARFQMQLKKELSEAKHKMVQGRGPKLRDQLEASQWSRVRWVRGAWAWASQLFLTRRPRPAQFHVKRWQF